MNQSYATPFTEQIAFHNVQGGDDPTWIHNAFDDGDDFVTRAKDRWGNVKCNDMGVINLVERRRWSGVSAETTVSSAKRSVSIATYVALIVFVAYASIGFLVD